MLTLPTSARPLLAHNVHKQLASLGVDGSKVGHSGRAITQMTMHSALIYFAGVRQIGKPRFVWEGVGLQPLKEWQVERRACECVLWGVSVRVDESRAKELVLGENRHRDAFRSKFDINAGGSTRCGSVYKKQNSTLGVNAEHAVLEHLEAVKGPGMKHGTAIHVRCGRRCAVGSGEGVVCQ